MTEMQPGFFISLLSTISDSRLSPYRQPDDNGDITCYARYLWNTALSESLYPALQGLEIALRNSIHNCITIEFGSEDWFDSFLQSSELMILAEVKERLIAQGKALEAGQLVASSSFGFWVSLFNSRYENVLWPKLLKDVFPYIPRSSMSRRTLSRRLNRIRWLRNRVFHHEPIWYRGTLLQDHGDILEIIGWISPAMSQMVEVIDRFTQVHLAGVGRYEELLSSSIDNFGNR